MASLNRVFLMGSLTRDVEVRQAGQTPVGSFGLAVTRKFKGRNGDAAEEVLFIDCEAWGRTADVMAQYLGKGRSVLIEGHLKLDQWQDKDGAKRSRIKAVVESFQFVGGKVEGQRAPTDHQKHGMDAEDIPF